MLEGQVCVPLLDVRLLARPPLRAHQRQVRVRRQLLRWGDTGKQCPELERDVDLQPRDAPVGIVDVVLVAQAGWRLL